MKAYRFSIIVPVTVRAESREAARRAVRESLPDLRYQVSGETMNGTVVAGRVKIVAVANERGGQ